MLLKTNDKTLLDEDEGGLPIPSHWVSNGEFTPADQTPKQKKIEAVRCTLPEDRLALTRAEYQTGAIPSLRTYGPKTRRDFLKMAFGGREPGRPTKA